MATDAEQTQTSAETWASVPEPELRYTQGSVEHWATSDRDPLLRATQHSAEVWVNIHRPNDDWFTQASAEVWVTGRALGMTYPVYPTLPGLGYSVNWKPGFANLPTQVAANKAEIDLSLADTPIHEFELTYDFLRDRASYLQSAITNEFRTFGGFFLRLRANAGRFVFDWTDDDAVTGELVGTTDGVSTDYGPLQRTFGVGDNVGVEPVGYVNIGETVNVYLDGVLQSSGAYTIDRTIPCSQQLHWLLAPAGGQVITIDMHYYYYCKFADPDMSFEKFMDLLWTVKRVTLRSCRSNA